MRRGGEKESGGDEERRKGGEGFVDARRIAMEWERGEDEAGMRR